MMEQENIKKAIDSFEDDNFISSQEILKKEIKKAKNDYLKKELDLENDVEEIEPEDKEEDNEDDLETKED